MDLNPDWSEFIASFDAQSVKYLIVGAVAGSYHGVPRTTGDIDLWYEPTVENAAKVRHALVDFGFASLGLSVSDLVAEDLVLQLGFPPRRIDLLTSVDGLEFEPAYRRAVVVEVGTDRLRLLGREDFIANKRAVGRPKDLADIAAIEG